MVDWFQKVLSKEWNITPAGGLTGDAYIAEKGQRRLFLKRNSSPFLAVLSAEGIVPKLVWTKRLENGDVITAQEWLDARELQPEEMQHQQVAHLLRKIHQSTELLDMLKRLGKKPNSSENRLQVIKSRLEQASLSEHHTVKQALNYLEKLLYVTENQRQVVCHCDLNHNNLLLTDHGKLFLIDWENAMITDPVIDYGLVLQSYIPKENWQEWLLKYGIANEAYLHERMYWYLVLDTLHYMSFHKERMEDVKFDESSMHLEALVEGIRNNILD
ncbi:phosphotransferase family protein [Ornithinibacillus gellani]|uniref:phosphotransferase family protein n=1 Tax=Ornithinibacillus gellani TaxID=2293253 RepID=UPI000F498AE7|nr:phosphotransferase family protein [Ornithinibacillus gellani]TQS75421.1 phosphotransferase family protein [Ornithinibacillus gellani]